MGKTGRIVRGVGGFYDVLSGEEVFTGKARGILKRGKSTLLVGDVVEFDFTDNGECSITALKERKNFLERPPVSNIDMLIAAFAAADPEPNLLTVDKICAHAAMRGMDVAVCITKPDLVTEEKLAEYVKIYGQVYETVTVNGLTGAGIDDVRRMISGKSVAIAGPSGIGKSTLVNRLIKTDRMKVGGLSDRTGRGKHTTRHVEIFRLDDGTESKNGTSGTFVYDTPGFTSIDAPPPGLYDAAVAFPEINEIAAGCKYSDCRHINEPFCAVKEAVADGRISDSRYGSYKMILEEVTKWRR